MSPNPSSVQLFSNNNAPSMTLKFITTKPIIINIVSLYGSSKLYLEDEKNVVYSLRGRDDRLSLAIPYIKNVSTLIIEDLNYKEDDEYNEDYNFSEEEDQQKIVKPSSAFYVEYYLRSNDLNFDEVYLGKTTEFAYKQSDFPLYYYSKVDDYNNSINAFFMLHDIDFENEPNIFNSNDLVLRGSIIPQKTVYLIKLSKETKPNVDKSPIVGKYDPSLKVGQIAFSKENLKSYDIAKIENPTIYLSFEKGSSTFKIKKVRVELTAVQENSDVPVTEKLYQYGKLHDSKTIHYYRLKVDNSTGYMRIQFSTNSKCLDYSINENKNQKTNSSYNFETKFERGKSFITFKKPENKEYIYLNVFLKSNIAKADQVVNNYAFKYINADDKTKFFEYKILNNDPKLKKSDSNDKTTISFNRINNNNDNVKITYSLKYAESKNMGKEFFNTTALTESNANVKVKDKDVKSDIISIEIEKKNYEYFQVIAQIIDGPIIEYVAYEPIGDFSFYDDFLNRKDEGNKNEEQQKSRLSTELIIVIIISCVLLVIVIVLVIVILTFNSKNKDLMDQVNKISFVQSGAKPKEDTNLLLDNENELGIN